MKKRVANSNSPNTKTVYLIISVIALLLIIGTLVYFRYPKIQFEPQAGYGYLTIKKVIVPADSKGVFKFSVSDQGETTGNAVPTFNELSHDESFTLTNLNPGDYVITETPVEGWTTASECYGMEDGTNIITAIISEGQNMICTFTNKKTPPGGGSAGGGSASKCGCNPAMVNKILEAKIEKELDLAGAPKIILSPILMNYFSCTPLKDALASLYPGGKREPVPSSITSPVLFTQYILTKKLEEKVLKKENDLSEKKQEFLKLKNKCETLCNSLSGETCGKPTLNEPNPLKNSDIQPIINGIPEGHEELKEYKICVSK